MIDLTQFEHGLTVKELKDIIKDWPEEDDMGNPCEVWIGFNGLSSQVNEVSPLNKREGDSGLVWADIILGC